MSRFALILINNRSYRHGFTSLRMMNESIRIIQMGLAFNEYSPFYETFNKKIDEMISNGLATRWISAWINLENFISSSDPIGPQILTLDDLGIAFQVCCIPLVLSVIAFVGELIFFWSKFYFKTIFNRLLGIIILRTYFHSFHNH